jgi:glycosyltransferase involved in cell wall biosynthesis
LEIIVIDDASTDESSDILRGYERDPRVCIIRHHKNLGHIKTYNEGLALARGKYVGLLSADDYCLRDDAIQRQIEVFEANPSVGMVYSAHVIVENDVIASQAIPWVSDYVVSGIREFSRLMWGNYIPASGTLLRHDVQTYLGPYDRELGHTGDWDMWLRASAKYDVGYISQPLYAYRMHQNNMSHNQVSPFRATDETLMTLERAFSSFGDAAPPELMRQQGAVFRHALLQSAWIDLFHGRHGRVWRGLAYALKCRPALAADGTFWRFVQHALLMVVAGRDGHQRVVSLLNGVRRPR